MTLINKLGRAQVVETKRIITKKKYVDYSHCKYVSLVEGVTKKSRLTFSSLAAPETTTAHPWYKNKSFIMKFPLKWGIVHFCRLIKTGNIEQNVFFVKTQFLRFCNFFHKKIVKSKLVNFAKMKTQKFMILLQFFINWTTMRVKVYANNWSAKNRDQ